MSDDILAKIPIADKIKRDAVRRMAEILGREAHNASTKLSMLRVGNPAEPIIDAIYVTALQAELAAMESLKSAIADASEAPGLTPDQQVGLQIAASAIQDVINLVKSDDEDAGEPNG